MAAPSQAITNAGKALFAGRLIDANVPATVPQPSWVHWGTDNLTDAAATQNALVAPATEARVGTSSNPAATVSRVTGTVTNDTYQIIATLTANAAKTIAEIGIFDAATAGNMIARATFTGIALALGDGIQWTLQIRFT